MNSRTTTTGQLPGKAPPTHLGYLDSLRGIAILSVVLVHSAILTRQAGKALMIGFTGQRGVQLFYMISAFTLCLSLDTRKKEHHPLGNFFLRRFFRIAPLFYLIICANLLLNRLAPAWNPLPNFSRVEIASGFLFLNGALPRAINSLAIGGWSIAIETTFYLLLPFLNKTLSDVPRTAFAFALSAIFCGEFSYYLARHYSHDPILEQYFGFLWFPVEFPVFLLGMLTYRIWQRYLKEGRLREGERTQLSLLFLLASALIYQGCLPFEDSNVYASSLLFLFLIFGLAVKPWPLLVNRFTRLIGKISYSMYLIHFFLVTSLVWLFVQIDALPSHLITRYVYGHHAGWLLAYALVIGMTIPISLLSWRFIENPGIQAGRLLIAHLEGRRAQRFSTPESGLQDLMADKLTRDAQF